MFSAATKSGKQASAAANYIEDVFSTYLYTGTAATQTITNNINLSTYGGLVWAKARQLLDHGLFDTVRGVNKRLSTNSTNAQITYTGSLTSFNSNGFSLGADSVGPIINGSGYTYVSWTFRKQAKFFDVVTYTGNGNTLRTLSHSLGSVPGCIIVKNTSNSSDWCVSHRSLNSSDSFLKLNSTSSQSTGFSPFPNSGEGGWPTSTQFIVKNSAINPLNTNGDTYVAYLFAHNAGGFGLTGTDNVISCGSFTTDASGNATVNLGYEPQWTLVKSSSADDGYGWILSDNMRGMAAAPATNNPALKANSSAAESGFGPPNPTATGFNWFYGAASTTYIYIAIRRGPMRTPTSGTSVFTPVARAGTSAAASISSGFVTDLIFDGNRTGGSSGWWDRLRGPTLSLSSYGSAAEFTDAQTVTSFSSMTGVSVGSDTTNGFINQSPITYVNYMLGRAPGFFDVVCYTGTGSATTQAHNLGVVPELIIVKGRSPTGLNWRVGCSYLNGGSSPWSYQILLNSNAAASGPSAVLWNGTAPTSAVFSVGTSGDSNGSGSTYVAYLFASCPGVSKVGTYTGTGATQTINCGFTGGARFVLIKRTNGIGDWYFWDTARGMVAGSDPSLQFNNVAPEVNANSVYTTTGGFQIVSTATGINLSGGTYIFLAIA